MRFSPSRREHASSGPRDRLGALRKALDQAGIGYSPANPLIALPRLPISEAPANIHPCTPQCFESPLPRPVKTAFFTQIFRAAPDVTSPELLVMPLNTALELSLGSAGTVSAMVVITSIADAPLADHHRDLLWRSLGLPVFEQLTAWDGAVIARECEIHDGLHVAEEAIMEIENAELLLTHLGAAEPVLRARTGLSAELVFTYCECGRGTPRLKNLAVKPARVKTVPARYGVRDN